MKSKSFKSIDDVLAYYGWGGGKKGEVKDGEKGRTQGTCKDSEETGQQGSNKSLLEEPCKGA